MIPGWSRDFDAWAADARLRRDGSMCWPTSGTHRDAVCTGRALHPNLRHLRRRDRSISATKVVIEDFQMGLAKRSFQVA